MADTAHLACTYAALILYDDGQDITGQKIATLLSAAGLNVASYWPKLFAKAVEGQNISSFFNFGADSSASSAPAPVVAKEAPKQEAKKDDKKGKKEVPPPPKEEEEEGGMGGLFD